jgi:hypothetical protein
VVLPRFLRRRALPTKQQILDSFDHNIAQFQMQIKKETDAAKRATLEELLVRERAKHRAMSRS